MYENLSWTCEDDCDICTSKLPEGHTGYTGKGHGIHVFVVAWTDEGGAPRADGAVTHMWQGVVKRLTPDAALEAAAVARAAVQKKTESAS